MYIAPLEGRARRPRRVGLDEAGAQTAWLGATQTRLLGPRPWKILAATYEQMGS